MVQKLKGSKEQIMTTLCPSSHLPVCWPPCSPSQKYPLMSSLYPKYFMNIYMLELTRLQHLNGFPIYSYLEIK